MVAKSIKYLMGVFFVVLLLSCTKLPEPGNVGMEVMKLGDAIPSDWGDLIAANSSGESGMYVRLWFQDKDKNIYTIIYDVGKNKFSGEYGFLKRM